MVRLKNRYLLLDILYPDSSTWPSTKTVSAEPHAAQLAIHAPTSDALTPGLLAKMIREEVGEMYGDWGVGKLGGASATGVQVKYLSPATSTAIIRCPRASFRLVWSALTYMSHVPAVTEPGTSGAGQRRPNGGRERPCVFRVLRVSGTMRKAEEEAIRRARREIVRVRGLEERGVLGDLISGVQSGSGKAVMTSVMDVSEDEDEGMFDDSD
ncbi:RNA-binding protein pop5 [Penicillium ochrochloron]